MCSGVRPIIFLASMPTASGRPSRVFTATTDGSSSTTPRPRTYTKVFAVPRSIAMSRPITGAYHGSDTASLQTADERPLDRLREWSPNRQVEAHAAVTTATESSAIREEDGDL